jgi:hypothetical protein
MQNDFTVGGQSSDLSSPDFTTRDFRLATYLKTSGFTPRLTPVRDDGIVVFEFPGSPGVHEAIKDYAVGEARVDPVGYEDARSALYREMRVHRDTATRDPATTDGRQLAKGGAE